jgi:hypothetical protein
MFDSLNDVVKLKNHDCHVRHQGNYERKAIDLIGKKT